LAGLPCSLINVRGYGNSAQNSARSRRGTRYPLPVNKHGGTLLLRKLTLTVVVVLVLISITGQTAQAHDWYSMVYNCEARGQPNPWYTNTGNGFYFGPQFTIKTWHSSGGGPVLEMGDRNGRPMRSYSISYIIHISENTLRLQGYGAWPNCYRYL
jgi:Transglycosylase-like domain